VPAIDRRVVPMAERGNGEVALRPSVLGHLALRKLHRFRSFVVLAVLMDSGGEKAGYYW
jgi:hypothetical protein